MLGLKAFLNKVLEEVTGINSRNSSLTLYTFNITTKQAVRHNSQHLHTHSGHLKNRDISWRHPRLHKMDCRESSTPGMSCPVRLCLHKNDSSTMLRTKKQVPANHQRGCKIFPILELRMGKRQNREGRNPLIPNQSQLNIRRNQ